MWRLTSTRKVSESADIPEFNRAKNESKHGSEERGEEEMNMEKLVEHIHILSKQVLANSQQLRLVLSLSCTTFQMPGSSLALKGGATAGVQYNEAVQGQKNHGRGPSHPHIFLGMAEGLVQEQQVQEAQKNWLKKLVEALNNEGSEAVQKLVLDCTCKETYQSKEDKDKGKPKLGIIQFVLEPMYMEELAGIEEKGVYLALKLRAVLTQSLKTTEGSTQKFGPAPRGQMERIISSKMKALEKGKLK